MKIDKLGVVGIGNIGTGVVHSLAESGYKVVAVDILPKALEKAKKEIEKNSLYYCLYSHKKPKDPKEILGNIEFTTNYEKLAECSYIIENVTEDLELKEKVHQKINEVCKKDAIVAVNTSCISITKMASLRERPETVIGMHFMNPVPIMDAVEVIEGSYTSEETIEISKELLKGLGKEGILVKDSPGFVSNRVMTFMINEAVYLVQEKVASVDDIDRLFRKCYGQKMGPLETCDLIGIDTILNSMIVLYESFNDSKYRPCPLLRKMVYEGKLGKKSGEGFYKYNF